ncbi:MAG: dTDP-4-dehydrorhamnose reductase [Parcubacteria group bacterium GW2011_GWC2_45_7]|nr:MAG: dTDP-4-dehydrorhamnose reductase [Parcubacteria group bacterium GW2011_GWC2_45_7]KKU73694.1 MAG: dTDP-4-dehydrorhamnose reductase [Parcubacteria group bacterium GW2011_GWA2_47_26]
MHILVIGAKGMLGQEFVRQLRDKDVVGWGREDIDITNAAEVMQKIGDIKPGLIINCAAYNNVDKAENEPQVAMAINGEAIGYLAAAALKCGAAFVHFSSDYVFSGELSATQLDAAACNFVTIGYMEEDLPNPVSVYGQSKALGENKIVSIPRGRAEWTQWYIVRTSRLFGLSGIGVTSKKSFPEMMLKFAREKGRIEAIDAEVSSPTYVKDLAEATLKMVEGDAPSGIYHISNSGSCTWYEYAKVTIECVGLQNVEVVPVGQEHFPRKAKRPAFSVLLNNKLPLLRPWQEALREYLISKFENGFLVE